MTIASRMVVLMLSMVHFDNAYDIGKNQMVFQLDRVVATVSPISFLTAIKNFETASVSRFHLASNLVLPIVKVFGFLGVGRTCRIDPAKDESLFDPAFLFEDIMRS